MRQWPFKPPPTPNHPIHSNQTGTNVMWLNQHIDTVVLDQLTLILHFKSKVSVWLQEKSAFFFLLSWIKGPVCDIYWHLVGRNGDAYEFKKQSETLKSHKLADCWHRRPRSLKILLIGECKHNSDFIWLKIILDEFSFSFCASGSLWNVYALGPLSANHRSGANTLK